jgi:hypothetical protein
MMFVESSPAVGKSACVPAKMCAKEHRKRSSGRGSIGLRFSTENEHREQDETLKRQDWMY